MPMLPRTRPQRLLPVLLEVQVPAATNCRQLCRPTRTCAASPSLSTLLDAHQNARLSQRFPHPRTCHLTAYKRYLSSTASASSSSSERLGGRSKDGHDDTIAASAGPNASSNDATYLVEMYEQMCRSGGSARDEHQIRALAELDRLRFQLIQRYRSGSTSGGSTTSSSANTAGDKSATEEEGGGAGGFFGNIFSSVSAFGGSNSATDDTGDKLASPPPRGVYIHGGVGCGKTFCMDLFYNSIVGAGDGENDEDRPKLQIGAQKVHFHSFMLNKVHKQMHAAKMVEGVQGDVLPWVIEKILDDGHLIAFDEFQVTDVADALILRRLFTGLIDQGAIIVATSNRPPKDLYLNGLQRDRFLPFIALLEEKTSVVSMWESDTDYRLIQGASAAKGVYFVGEASRGDFDDVFIELTKGETVAPTSLTTQGRRVQVPLASLEVGCAKFHFGDLCKKALGAADYICIGENFHTVFVDGVPKLTLDDINVLRRLITFIDCMYEAHVKLVLQLETQPKEIFDVDLSNAHQDEAFSFDRTRSRLDEMGSKEYLKKRWTGRSNDIAIGQTEDMKHELEFLVEEDDGIQSEKEHKKGRHLYRHAKAAR